MIDAKRLTAALNAAMEGIDRVPESNEAYTFTYCKDAYGILEAVYDAVKASGDWSEVDKAVDRMKSDLKNGSSVP